MLCRTSTTLWCLFGTLLHGSDRETGSAKCNNHTPTTADGRHMTKHYPEYHSKF